VQTAKNLIEGGNFFRRRRSLHPVPLRAENLGESANYLKKYLIMRSAHALKAFIAEAGMRIA
jgi:hypothetical protein